MTKPSKADGLGVAARLAERRRGDGLPGLGVAARLETRSGRRVGARGQGRRNTIVAGPPCSGKNTYVQEHRGPHDLVVDVDALRTALGGPPEHDADGHHWLPFALEARDAVLARLSMGRDDLDHVWIIACAPRREQREFLPGAAIVVLDTPAAVCHERAAAERPDLWHRLIDDWFSEYEPDPVAYWHNRSGDGQ